MWELKGRYVSSPSLRHYYSLWLHCAVGLWTFPYDLKWFSFSLLPSTCRLKLFRHSTHPRISPLTFVSLSFNSLSPPSSFPPPSLSHRLFLSSSHHSVEGPSDIWLSPASRGSRRCRRFWQAGTGTPRGPDGDSWTRKRKKVHIIKCTRSQKHTYALGVHMHKQTIAQTEQS